MYITLPNELWAKIISLLPISDYLSCIQTCKALNDASKLIDTFQINKVKDVEKFFHVAKSGKFQRVIQFEIYDASNIDITQLVEVLKIGRSKENNLCSFVVHRIPTSSWYKFKLHSLIDLLAPPTKVMKLELDVMSHNNNRRATLLEIPAELWRAISNISILKLPFALLHPEHAKYCLNESATFNECNVPVVYSISATNGQLNETNTSYENCLDKNLFSPLLDSDNQDNIPFLSKLERLSVSWGYMGYIPICLHDMSLRSTTLKELDLYRCSNVELAALHFPSLEVLKFTLVTITTPLTELATQFPLLRRFCIESSILPTQVQIRCANYVCELSFRTVSGVETLHVENLPNLLDLTFVDGNQSLTTVSIKNVPKLQPSGLKLRCCCNLEDATWDDIPWSEELIQASISEINDL